MQARRVSGQGRGAKQEGNGWETNCDANTESQTDKTDVAMLGCPLDHIWNDLEPRNGGHTWDPDLEAGRHNFHLGHTFCWKPV